MQAVIIEDEKNAAERLEAMLGKIAPDIEIVKTIDTVEESVSWLSMNSPDVIFLDIHLGDGSSFRIFDYTIPDSFIIFTTAYDEYAIKAFKLNSIDYLLKPINKLDLASALEKLRKYASGGQPANKSAIKNMVSASPEYKRRFLVQIGTKLKTIETREIAYFYAMEKNVFFATFDKKYYPADLTIKALEEKLDPDRFFRINRKFIISLESIKGMTAFSRGRIKIELQPPLQQGLEAIVSIDRADEFRKWLDR
jgi:DNA-binding LytR/AlgR family response regulator